MVDLCCIPGVEERLGGLILLRLPRLLAMDSRSSSSSWNISIVNSCNIRRHHDNNHTVHTTNPSQKVHTINFLSLFQTYNIQASALSTY